ncbi:MAG: helix-turn-helix domain-containing protein [Bilifractor sp.]
MYTIDADLDDELLREIDEQFPDVKAPEKLPRKKIHIITYEDRQKIQKMLENGERIPYIAQIIGTTDQAMYREIRLAGTPYDADYAQGLR